MSAYVYFNKLAAPQLEVDFLTLVKEGGLVLTEVKKYCDPAKLAKAATQLEKIEEFVDILCNASIRSSLPCTKVASNTIK